MTSENPTGSVPVFNCVVHVDPRGADGSIHARVVNLPGIEATGQNEREALGKVVAAFKAAVSRYHGAGEPIPFIDNNLEPRPGEIQRLIAVHL
jgi:hypothetical protein